MSDRMEQGSWRNLVFRANKEIMGIGSIFLFLITFQHVHLIIQIGLIIKMSICPAFSETIIIRKIIHPLAKLIVNMNTRRSASSTILHH